MEPVGAERPHGLTTRRDRSCHAPNKSKSGAESQHLASKLLECVQYPVCVKSSTNDFEAPCRERTSKPASVLPGKYECLRHEAQPIRLAGLPA